jgi:hypothetical protein
VNSGRPSALLHVKVTVYVPAHSSSSSNNSKDNTGTVKTQRNVRQLLFDAVCLPQLHKTIRLKLSYHTGDLLAEVTGRGKN